MYTNARGVLQRAAGDLSNFAAVSLIIEGGTLEDLEMSVGFADLPDEAALLRAAIAASDAARKAQRGKHEAAVWSNLDRIPVAELPAALALAKEADAAINGQLRIFTPAEVPTGVRAVPLRDELMSEALRDSILDKHHGADFDPQDFYDRENW